MSANECACRTFRAVPILLTMRTFGIEIECYGLTPSKFAENVYRVNDFWAPERNVDGIPTLCNPMHLMSSHRSLCLPYYDTNKQHANTYQQWKIKVDTSIDKVNQHGFELNSPIYNDYESLAWDLKRIIKVVKTVGCTTNNMCGLHVHVGWDDSLGLKQLKHLDLLKEFWKTVKVPPEFLPKNSRKSYCQIPPQPYDKYSCLNINSRYPTVEFRLFNCCLNSRYIWRAVKFSLDTTETLNQFLQGKREQHGL